MMHFLNFSEKNPNNFFVPFRRKSCPCFPKTVVGETPEAYCQRMDALAEVTVARLVVSEALVGVRF